jgi:salicylate hydroxylase
LPSLTSNSKDFVKTSTILGPRLAETIFKPYAEKRQPRTSNLVKGARAQGERRVLVDPELCRSRDEQIAAGWKDADGVAARYDGLLCEPYESLETLITPKDDHEAKD